MIFDTISSPLRQRTQDSTNKVVCRPIEAEHLPAIIDLLQTGFPRQSRRYWECGLRRLSEHTPPPGFPQFGDMLEVAGRPVGVHLLISGSCTDDPYAPARCNGSSWYVDEEFRSYGTILAMRGTRRQPAVYTDIGPRSHTIPTITALGFRLFSRGIFACMPALGRAPAEPTQLFARPSEWKATSVPDADQRLLVDHDRFGCIGLWCETPSGGQPVIVRRRYVKPGVPCAQLIYCRSLRHFTDVARPVGRFLAGRGMPFLLVTTDEPLTGVPGRLFPDKLPMYFKGATPPRVGDLTYTEVAVFGM